MKVLHLITGLETGGAETMLAKIVTSRDRSAAHVVVSMTTAGTIGPRIAASGVRVLTLGMKRGRVEWRALGRFRTMLREEQPDVIQSWLYHADLLATLATSFGRTFPLAWNIRCSVMTARRYKFLVRALALLSRTPRAVVVNSTAALVAHRERGYRPRRWSVIPNGFNTEVFRPRDRQAARALLGLPDRSPVIGIVGRYDEMKDHSTFLAAARRVRERVPDSRFVMAGPGVTRENQTLRSEIEKERLEESVTLLGDVPDTSTLYSAFDVNCLSSAYGESFPNVLGEAMASEVPCVATDVGDSREIVADTGSVVPPRQPEALGWALIQMLEKSPSERADLGKRARLRVIEHYSIEAIVRQYETLYAELAAAQTATSRRGLEKTVG